METSCAIQGAAIMTGRPDAARFPSGFPAGGEENRRPRFTDGAPDGFFRKPAVLPAIRARHHSPIRGFVPQNRKTREEFCAILDLRAGGAPGHGNPGFPLRGAGALPGNAPPSCAPEKMPGRSSAARRISWPPPPLPGGCRKGVPARRSSPSVLRGGIPRHLPQQGNCLLSITQEGRRVTSVLPLYGRNAM